MTTPRSLLADRAAELRAAFDRSFAEAQALDPPATEDLLALRLDANSYALRLSEIAGLFADKRITPVPSGAVAMLGIAGFRGIVVPVYDLGVLLGYQRTKQPRWLAVTAAVPLAVAFAVFEGHLRMPRAGIVAQDPAAATHRHVTDFVRAQDRIWPIVHLASVVERIKAELPRGAA